LTTAIKSTLSSSAAVLALVCAACGGPGNTGNTVPGSDPVPANPGLMPPDPTTVPIIDKIPWVNGASANLDPTTQQLLTSSLPYYPPLSTAIIANFDATKPNIQLNGDDSSLSTAPIDCSVAAPYELAPWLATSEPESLFDEAGQGDYPGIAIRWAGADDLTRGSWRVPGFTTWYPGLLASLPSIWGTPAEAVPTGAIVPTCDGQPNNWVIHMRGAGFRYYGGNIAHILAGDNYPMTGPANDPLHCPPGSDLCRPVTPDGATTNSAGFPLAPTKNDRQNLGTWELPALHTYWDVSKYDGVSFWARRGPDSMGTLLVTLAEKHTSDDMNRQNETYCRRILACHSTCQNYQQCLPSTISGDVTQTDPANPTQVLRCYDPAKGMPPLQTGSSGASDDELDAVYPRCGSSACTFRQTYPDADFEGKECKPYTFTSGESNEYCYNADGHDALGNVVPVDPPPPSRFDRCVDGYTSTVQLSTEWTLYTLPFSEMRQGGYGKVSPYFDLTSLYSITLGWGVGNVDFFFDDISFYRVKPL
jgi:hypothetical protein